MPLLDFRSQSEKDNDNAGGIIAAGLAGLAAPVPYQLWMSKKLHDAPHKELLLDAKDIVQRPAPKGSSGPGMISHRLEHPKLERMRELVGAPADVPMTYSPLDYEAHGPAFLPFAEPTTGKLKGAVMHPRDMPMDLAIMGHEMGHSTMVHPGGMGKLRARLLGINPALGAAVGLVSSGLIDPEDNSQIGGVMAAQSLLAAPRLAEEGYASYKSVKALRAMQAAGELSEAAVKAGRNKLLKAFGTYAAVPAAALLGSAGIIAARRGAFERD